MVAIFTGAGTGFERGSGSVLGSAGLLGSAALGRGNEQVFLNAATGNLMISHQDEFLVGLGSDISVTRTYNSLGDLSDENQDNWRDSSDRKIFGLTGTVNTTGSTVHRISADGSDITYSWNGTAYVATDGAGAYDTLTFSSNIWTWTDGNSQAVDKYALFSTGSGTGTWRLWTARDADGYGLTYTRTSTDQVSRITTSDGSYVQYDWSGNNITDILTGYKDLKTSTAQTLTRTRYAYDAQNRLQTVTVDLSPGDSDITDGNIYTTTYTYVGTSTRVASISQSDGSYVAISYDASNRVSIIDQTASSGVTRRSTISYDTGFTTITDPLGQAVRLDYDASNNLTKITMPPASSGASPQVSQFGYDTSGNVTSVTDALSNSTSYSNFVNGMAQTITDRLGNVTTRTYGAKNEILTETTTSSDTSSAAATHTVRYAYDAENHLRYRVEADGSVTEYRYTGSGDLQYVVAYPEQTYDVSTLAPGTSIALADLDSWQAALPDKSSLELRYLVYDARYNVIQERTYSIATTAGVASTTEGYVDKFFTYDQAGQLLSRNFLNRNVESFVYDGMGRLVSAVDVNGGTTNYVFDDANTKTIVTLASGLIQTSTYNKAGELVSYSESTSTTAGYDELVANGTFDSSTTGWVNSNGSVLSAVSGRLRVAQSASPQYGPGASQQFATVIGKTYRLRGNSFAGTAGSADIRVGTSSGGTQYGRALNADADITFVATTTTVYITCMSNTTPVAGAYVEFDNISLVEQPVGTATFAYDQDGLLRWETDATGNKSYHIYDAAGRKVADVDAAGEMVEYRYDADNRLVSSVAYGTALTSAQLTTLNDNNAVIDVATFRPAASAGDIWNWRVYDKEGRLVQAIDGTGTTTINTYDGAGRLTQSIDYRNNVASSIVDNWKATGTGPSAITNPYPVSDPGNQVTRYFYDSDGHRVGTLDAEGYLTQTVYDDAGQVTDQIAYATATNTANRAAGTFSLLVGGLANSAIDRHTRYVHDGQGQLRFIVDSTLHVIESRFDTSGDGTTTIAYANALPATTTDFTYDSLDAAVAVAGFASAADRTSWSVNNSAGKAAYSIDAEGGVTAFAYNASGQVTKSTQFATVRATTALPSRATMDSWATTNGTNAANRVTRYFYDGAGVLRYTVDGEGYVTRWTEDAEGRLTKTERFANASAFDDTATIDSVHSWVVASGGTNAATTNFYDATGRLLSVTDPVGSVRRYAYNANGTLQSETAAYGTADASTTYYVRDSKGRVTEEHRAYGTSAESVTKYAYDVLGNVSTITDPDNNVTTQTFDHFGRVLTRTDALTGVTSYQYNGFGEVVRTTDPLGRNSYTYYDQLGRVRKTSDALKYVTETTYNSFGDIVSVIRRYSAATNTPSVTVEPTVTANAKDATTSFTYDDLGRLKSTTDSEGYTESYVLNAFGNRISVTNKVGGVTTNTFDERGLLLSETLPMASVNSAGTIVASTVTNRFTYDSRGNRISMIEASGLAEQRTTIYTYDAADRLLTKKGDAVTKVAYNDFTSTTAVTVTTTANVVPTETYAYDGRGNLSQVTDANGAKTFSYYDALGRKIAEVGPLGTLTSYTYDDAGNKLSDRVYGDFVTLPASPGGTPPAPVNGSNYRETTYGYDALNRLSTTSIANALVGDWNGTTGVTSATQTVTSSPTYDAAGNVIISTDARGNMVYSWYDALNRKTGQLDQEGYLTTWTYDAEGNVLSERRYATQWTGTVSASAAPAVATSANDRVTTFTYDETGHRLTETRTGVAIATVSTSNGVLTASTVSSTVTYTYNGLGQVKTKQEASGDTVAYTYDSTGRLTKESRAAYDDYVEPDTTTVTPTVTYSYDGLNNLTRTQQGDATLNSSTDRITTYAYGAGGRLASMTDAASGTHSYDYDAAGNLVRDTYSRLKSNGTSVAEGILYRRDLLGRVVTQAVATNNSGTWTRGDSQNTQFDAYGEVSQRGINGLWQESFTYNNRGLVEKTNSGDGVWRFFVYDENGNRTLAIESEGNDYGATSLSTVLAALGSAAGATYVDGVNTTISIFDRRNMATQTRLPQRELTTVGGTRTSLNTSQAYNAFGEVASQTDARGNVTSFGYNTMGRMTSKVMPTVSYMKADNTTATAAPAEYYYYDPSGRLVATKDANGNVTSRLLLAGSGYGGTDALVTAEFHPDGGKAQTFYDVFGEARILRNELNQDETRTYDKMGRLITQVNRGGLLTDNYTYDLLGQRITHWNSLLGSTVKETTDYDLQGRVVSAVAFGGDGVTSTYAWSATLATSGMGTFGGWTQTDTYANSKTMVTTGDIFGHDLSKTDLGGHAFTYSYDKGGRQVSRAITGETLTTTWLNSGLVAKLSTTASDYTTSTYDANGNKLTEYTVRGGVVAQNATATWDALNRMATWAEAGGSVSPISSKTLDYDLNGNVRHTHSSINNLDPQGTAIGQSTWDTYNIFDVMNRQISGDGSTNYYNAAGQRVRVDRYQQRTIVIDGPLDGYDPKTKAYTAQLREDYVYNTDGTLKQMQYAESTAVDDGNGFTITVTDPSGPGAVRSSFTYDAMQRQTRQIDYMADASVAYDHSSVYNSKSQVTSETTTTKRTNGSGYDTYTDYTTNSFGTGTAYALGSIVQIDTQSYKNGSDSSVPDPRTINSYAWYDGAVQSTMTFDSDINTSSNPIYTSTYTLSASGVLNSVTIADGRPRTVTFKNDLNGMVIRRDESDNISTQGDPHNVYYRFDGKEIASVGNVAPTDGLSYVDSIDKRQAPPPDPTNYSFLYTGSPVSNPQRDIINSYSQGSAGGRYTVQAGDTLQGIAYQVWGDSSLWYKIADANGLSGDAGLIEGQSLQLPAGVTRSKQSASTFKPYDASEAIGDTSPTKMPKPPKKNKCGAFGQILLVAVAVAVTAIATAGIGALATGASFSSALGVVTGGSLAGLGATATTVAGVTTTAGGLGALGAIGVAAAGGAVGSIVSQGLGVATGIQQQFSWKGVALAAVAGGVNGAMSAATYGAQQSVKAAMQAGKTFQEATAQLSTFQKFMTSGSVLAIAARGAGASVFTQGIGVVTGLQDKFDWAGVAAAGTGAAAAGSLGRINGFGGLSGFNQRFFSSMASDIADAATRSVINGSDFGDNMIAALPDIIGQTVGGMVTDGISAPGGAGESDTGDEIIVTAGREQEDGSNYLTDPIILEPLELGPDFSAYLGQWAGTSSAGPLTPGLAVPDGPWTAIMASMSIVEAVPGLAGLAAAATGAPSSPPKLTAAERLAQRQAANMAQAKQDLADPHVQAFVDLIADRETNGRFDVIAGGQTFTDFSRHPNVYVKKLDSTAAGAYQFTAPTWRDMVTALGVTDFSPQSQKIGAVRLLRQLGAIQKLQRGDTAGAVLAAGARWDALPKSADGTTLAGRRVPLKTILDAYNKALPRYLPPPPPPKVTR